MKTLISKLASAFFISALFSVQIGISQLLDPVTHPKFVNPLPVPGQIDVTGGGDYVLEMNQTVQWLGLVDPVTNAPLMTTVWGYGLENQIVTYPGPTFFASKDVPVNMTFHNNLPGPHILPVDYSLHMAHPDGMDIQTFYEGGNIPTVVHLHGGHTESASDGLPEAWYTQGFNDIGNYFVKPTYTFHNDQEAATLWYHDHALGITRLNVYAGLAGFYLLEDNHERSLVVNGVLPKGKHDYEIVFQDRMFSADGELFLPSKSGDPWFGDLDGEALDLPFEPSVVAEFFGDFIVVNGMTWPYLDVEPRPYRFRLLNGSDSRTYIFQLGPPANPVSFLQIGTDNGLLPSPVSLNKLVLAPGERAEVVIDFNNYDNQSLTLYNYGPDGPFKGLAAAQAPANPQSTGLIMQFNVNLKLKANRGLPIASVNESTILRPSLPDMTADVVATRKLALFEGADSDGRLQPLLGVIDGDLTKSDGPLNGSLAWFEAITEQPLLGDTEEWWVYNNTEDAHPIHLHLVSFQIINRQPFEADVFEQDQIQHGGGVGIGGYVVESSITYPAPPEPPADNEKGWKDTFVVPPGYVGRVVAKFDRPGRYVWHCHILSHEDHEMMRPYEVLNPAAKSGITAQQQDDFINERNTLTLYPNPASGIVNLDLIIVEDMNVDVSIYSLDGRLVKSVALGLLSAGNHLKSINVSDIKKGVYSIELSAGGNSYTNRLIISE